MTEHPKTREAERQKELDEKLAEWKIQKDMEKTDEELGVNIPETTLKDVYEITEQYLHINDRNRIDLIYCQRST